MERWLSSEASSRPGLAVQAVPVDAKMPSEQPLISVVHLMRTPIALAFSVESLAQLIRDESKGFQFRVHHNWFHRPRPLGMLVDLLRAAFLSGDVFHVTGDCGYLALALPRSRTVLTVLDCASYRRMRGLRRWLYGALWIRLPVRWSRHVVVISDSVRQDVIAIAGVDSSKVHVIHCSILQEYFSLPSRPAASTGDPPVILQVGTMKHKNLERLAEALAGIACKLVIIGRPLPSQIEALMRFGIDYTVRERLSVPELVSCYRSCDLVVFPSTSEGFGLPVVEAQACGKPVVTSDIAVLREVAGAGACFVDPLDVASIRRGVQRVLSDADYRRDLVVRGLQNARRFETHRMLSAYEAVYREAGARRCAVRSILGTGGRSR